MTEMRNLLLIDKNTVTADTFREAMIAPDDGPFHLEWVQSLSQSLELLQKKTI